MIRWEQSEECPFFLLLAHSFDCLHQRGTMEQWASSKQAQTVIVPLLTFQNLSYW